MNVGPFSLTRALFLHIFLARKWSIGQLIPECAIKLVKREYHMPARRLGVCVNFLCYLSSMQRRRLCLKKVPDLVNQAATPLSLRTIITRSSPAFNLHASVLLNPTSLSLGFANTFDNHTLLFKKVPYNEANHSLPQLCEQESEGQPRSVV